MAAAKSNIPKKTTISYYDWHDIARWLEDEDFSYRDIHGIWIQHELEESVYKAVGEGWKNDDPKVQAALDYMFKHLECEDDFGEKYITVYGG